MRNNGQRADVVKENDQEDETTGGSEGQWQVAGGRPGPKEFWEELSLYLLSPVLW